MTALICIALSASTAAQAASTYYVSAQKGNDSWSGLLASPNPANSDGPFQTIGRAQMGMRSSSTYKTVTLRAGTYAIAQVLAFDWSDSGESWLSYTGENAILDGGKAGGISVTGVNNLVFKGLTIQNLAAGGVVFTGATAISLRWNTFLNCNQQCISGGLVTNSIIDSNTINGQSPGNPPGNTGMAYSAISLTYGSNNNQITHNLIENCQGGGVVFASGQNDPPNNDNIVDRNILQNVNTNVVDMGALYMYDKSHSSVGNQITNNVINGNGGTKYLTNWTKGIYLDDGMRNVLISGNICRSCGQYGFQIHASDHITIVNNIFDLSSTGTQLGEYQNDSSWQDFGMAGNVFQRNIVYFSGAAPSSLYQVNINNNDALPSTTRNLYWSANNSRIPNGLTIVDASPVNADPEFDDPSAGNYSMPSSSRAYGTIGFLPLATDQGPVAGGPVGSGSSGLLTGFGSSAATTANLTAEGPTDWSHWGTTSLTRKSGVTAQISNYSIVGGGPAYYYTNDVRPVSWTDGTTPRAGTVTDGVFINGQNGFSFTVPANTATHVLTVHVGGYFSGGTLTAHLSDKSAADFVDSTSAVTGQYDRNYTLNFHATSVGQTLTITWVRNSGTGNVTLNGAALK